MTKARTSIDRLYIVSMVTIALFSGCSKGPPKGIISGKVTLDGSAIKSGTIRFVPVDGKTTTAGGKIIDGEYRISTPVNKFKVSINSAAEQPAGPINDDAPLPKNLIPMKYNVRTELEVDIKEGENQKDFALTSR